MCKHVFICNENKIHINYVAGICKEKCESCTESVWRGRENWLFICTGLLAQADR